MSEVSSHPQGMPAWIELATSDDKAALEFYGRLFGWKDNPQPMGPGSFYHMQQLRGLDVAAIYQQADAEQAQGIPPRWQTYFAVTSADETADRAQRAGGRVLMEPFDVFDAGRMALIQDPQSAMFAVWQAKQHVGYRIVGEPGALAWNELLTTDPKNATAFYRAVLDVSEEQMPGPMGYTILKADGRPAAGIMQITPEMGPVPPNWFVYFMMPDVDATAEVAESLGGKVLMPPADIPAIGRFAMLQDPQGAVFHVFKPDQALGQQ